MGTRKHVDIPANIYRLAEQDARSLNMSTQGYMLLVLLSTIQDHCPHQAVEENKLGDVLCSRCSKVLRGLVKP